MAKRGKSKKHNGASHSLRERLRAALKWGFVACLWLGIGLGVLTAWYARELPGIIENAEFERKNSITMKDREGGIIDRHGELKGVSVSVADLPPHLIYAVLAVEDRRFYEHGGIDPVGIFRAVFVNFARGQVAQGGSTITQQLAKNLFLSHERKLKRKIQEALLALWLESNLSKDEILSAYLNRVYMGAGAYGIEAAARTYFHKSAKKLTLYESAMLAGLLKAPSRYSPESNPGLAAKRARVVLAAMKDAGYITDEEAKSLSETVPLPAEKPDEGGGEKYFADWIAVETLKLTGKTEADLVVETTLDPDIQKAAQAALISVLKKNEEEEKNVTQGAVLVMGRDGAILAFVGGRNYAQSQFNRVIQSRRPPGSSFKPFVYLAALEQGWRIDDLIEDAPIKQGKYRPQNYDGKYYGEITIEEALARSLNTATIRLAGYIGIGTVLDVARRAGIDSHMPREMSMALGSSGLQMLELARAYATIANDGYRISPYAIESIETSDGTPVFRRRQGLELQAFDEDNIRDLKDMLRRVVTDGTGRGALLPFYSAGKTGTSQDYRDAWFIGFTDEFVAVAWVGNDDNSPMKKITGGAAPATIWRETMMAAHRKGYHAQSAQRQDSSEDFADRLIARRGDNEQDSSFQGVLQRLFSFNE